MEIEHKLLENCIPVNENTIERIWKTIKNVFPDYYKLSPVGSFMKKQENSLYNDLDIAIEYDWDKRDHIKDLLLSYFGKDNGLILFGHDNHYLNVFNIAVKLDDNKYFQVDFMFVKNLEFAKFAFHSPDFKKNESKYKGMYASILLMSIIRNVPTGYRKHFEDGTLEEWKYYSLSQKDGLLEKHKTFIGVKGKRIKSPKLLEETFITYDVDEIMEIIFGTKDAINYVYTFEGLLDYICSNHFTVLNMSKKEFITRVKDDFLSDWQFDMKTSDELKGTFKIAFDLKIEKL